MIHLIERKRLTISKNAFHWSNFRALINCVGSPVAETGLRTLSRRFRPRAWSWSTTKYQYIAKIYWLLLESEWHMRCTFVAVHIFVWLQICILEFIDYHNGNKTSFSICYWYALPCNDKMRTIPECNEVKLNILTNIWIWSLHSNPHPP